MGCHIQGDNLFRRVKYRNPGYRMSRQKGINSSYCSQTPGNVLLGPANRWFRYWTAPSIWTWSQPIQNTELRFLSKKISMQIKDLDSSFSLTFKYAYKQTCVDSPVGLHKVDRSCFSSLRTKIFVLTSQQLELIAKGHLGVAITADVAEVVERRSQENSTRDVFSRC